jgi:hypothetical protein
MSYFDSDSGDESEFSGFGESDIELPFYPESESESSSDEDEPARPDGWSRNFKNLMVCFLLIKKNNTYYK